MRQTFARSTRALLALLAFALPASTHAFVVTINEFSIVRNGALFFEDTFSDSVPPPSAPDFTSGAAASYNVFGTFPGTAESGGLLQLDSANGGISANALELARQEQRVRLLTNIDPSNLAAGLKSDDTLLIQGLFSLTVPTGVFNPQYSIRFNDNPGGGAHQILQLHVRQNSATGDSEIRYILQDFDANTITELGSDPLAPPVGADEILLSLSRPDTANDNFFASYSYLAAGTVVGGGVFATPGLGFQGENFGRAEFNISDGFIAAIPEPGTLRLIVAATVALMIVGFARRGSHRLERGSRCCASRSMSA